MTSVIVDNFEKYHHRCTFQSCSSLILYYQRKKKQDYGFIVWLYHLFTLFISLWIMKYYYFLLKNQFFLNFFDLGCFIYIYSYIYIDMILVCLSYYIRIWIKSPNISFLLLLLAEIVMILIALSSIYEWKKENDRDIN